MKMAGFISIWGILNLEKQIYFLVADILFGMSQPTQISVELKNLEEFYAIQNRQGATLDFSTADGKQLFNHLRHNCTTYDDVLEKIKLQHGEVSELHLRLVKQSAAEVIIEHFRNDNETLQTDLEATRQEKRNLRATFNAFITEVSGLLQKLGVDSIAAGINVLDDLLVKVASTEQVEQAYERLEAKHQRSTNTFGRVNDAYRVHEVLTLDYLENNNIDPLIIENLRELYKKQSPLTAIPTYCDFSGSDRSSVINKVKPRLRYTDPSSLG